MSKGFEIVDGVYVGPKFFKGFLDLRDTGVTDLGDLREVGGSLWLSGTGVTDLGDLREIGNFVYTGSGCIYELPKLQDLVKEIESHSLNELVERLPVEKDPFLKRVVERRIRA